MFLVGSVGSDLAAIINSYSLIYAKVQTQTKLQKTLVYKLEDKDKAGSFILWIRTRIALHICGYELVPLPQILMTKELILILAQPQHEENSRYHTQLYSLLFDADAICFFTYISSSSQGNFESLGHTLLQPFNPPNTIPGVPR